VIDFSRNRKLSVSEKQKVISKIIQNINICRKAGCKIINRWEMYNGLKLAYIGGNIGVISNDITKIWNSNYIDLDIIKLLCMENNFVIDCDWFKTKFERKKALKF
jgi:hypothetical protein